MAAASPNGWSKDGATTLRELYQRFASSRVDITPVYTPDNRIMAVLPDSGSKDAYYVEPSAALLGEVLGKLFKGKQYHVADMSNDLKTVVVSSESDDKAPEYHVLDLAASPPKN